MECSARPSDMEIIDDPAAHIAPAFPEAIFREQWLSDL